MQEPEEYSTLEVAEQSPMIQVSRDVQDRDSNLPEVVSGVSSQPMLEGSHPPSSSIYSETQTPWNQMPWDRKHLLEPQDFHARSYSSYPPSNADILPAQTNAERRKCGMKRRTFYISLVVVAILIVAAAAGVAGGLSSRRNNSGVPDTSKASPTPAPAAKVTLHPSSSLAAANWTDSTQARIVHHAVFFQDSSNALLGSFWDAQNSSWHSVNISDVLAKRGNPISPLPGTSLAAAVTGNPFPFQLNLYYLLPGNVIGEVVTQSLDGADWAIGQLQTRFPRAAAEGSQLAVHWHRCARGCSQQIVVAFEDPSHRLAYLNGSDWSKPAVQPRQTVVVPGSGLALVPYMGDDGKNGLIAYEMRLFCDAADVLTEVKFNGSGRWDEGSQMVRSLNRNPAPRFAASVFDNFFQMVVVALRSDGEVTVNHWNRDRWNVNRKMTTVAGPGNLKFNAIAMNNDRVFYGVSGGKILKYVVDAKTPTSFVYSEEVPIS